MATLKLWKNFSKRKNSTKQPTATADYSGTVYLKDGTSLEQPVFVLHTDDFTYNYAQFENIYYFVDDIVSIKNDLSEIHCSKDHLATYKSEILASETMVLYYNHTNTEIADKRLATKTTRVISSNSGVFDALGTTNPNDPTIVLMVNGINSIGAYAIHQSDIAGILGSVNNVVDQEIAQVNFPTLQGWTQVIDWLNACGAVITRWFQRSVSRTFYSGGALENIRSAHILPLSISDVGGNSQIIYLGNFETNKSGLLITDQVFTDHATVNIPWPTGISDWRRNSPYLEFHLYIPYIGLVSLSSSDLIGEASLTISVSLDKFSGDAIFQVKTGSGNVIGHYTTNLKTDYPIGSSNVSSAKATGGMISSAVGAATAVAGIATGGAGAVILGGAAAAGLGIVNMASPTPTSIGGATGGAILGLTADKSKVTLYSVFHDTTVAPSNVRSVIGEPYNGKMSLSSISGFVQTASASINMTGFGNDKDIVNNYLNGGIYIE